MVFAKSSRIAVLILATLLPAVLFAAKVSVAVNDPSGAAITDAQFSLEPAPAGAVAPPYDLPPGTYKLTVKKQGFATAVREFQVANDPVSIVIDLKIEAQQTTLDVTGKVSRLANSDPNYRALRNALPSAGFHVENYQLVRDVGTFTFETGDFAFLPPVLGRTVMAVFTGTGKFHMKPKVPAEANVLGRITGTKEVDEAFRTVVLCFTDGTDEELRKAAKGPAEATSQAQSAFREFRSRVRHRGDEPKSMTEALLGFESIPNVEAELLAELYVKSRHSFTAYIHGQKHADLRFLVNTSGALPHLPSPEEVALINVDPLGEQDGVWYLSHMAGEWDNGTASSDENRRWVQALDYRVNTAIASNEHLGGTCTVKLKVLVDGTRIIKFGLLPALRVSSVKQGAQEIGYIQEGRKEDGSFFVVLPVPAKANSQVELTIDYDGDKVIRNEGGGSFAVGARTSWYPSLNSFTDRAKFDLTFSIPKRYTLVSVGKLENSSVDKDQAVSHWVSEVPLAVAGFNYGDFKKSFKHDDPTNYDIEAYATKDAPDYLKKPGEGSILSPASMAQNSIIEAQNSIRVFEEWFGKIPYGRIAITQQPQFNFGQSWPSLVYLPVSAFLDSTQRWTLLGANTFKFAEFIEEVTPHEVSHQWWGHALGWATYHDQWLSEGFADFSAGLYLQATGQQDRWTKYLDRQVERITRKNNFGLRANDAGPLWMGERLNTFKTPRAYNDVVYPKGGMVLHMLRQLMWDPQTQDKDFIALMHDFVKRGFNQNVSTESFRAVVELHMKPGMDLTGNKSMAWFFSQWVYGTELPKYKMEYSLKKEDDGKYLLTGHVTQSEVGANFIGVVPLYAEFENKQILRLGSTGVAGNQTSKDFQIRLPKKPKRVVANLYHDVLALETVSTEKSGK